MREFVSFASTDGKAGARMAGTKSIAACLIRFLESLQFSCKAAGLNNRTGKPTILFQNTARLGVLEGVGVEHTYLIFRIVEGRLEQGKPC